MKAKPSRLCTRKVNTLQFESIQEALEFLPEELVLEWINACYANFQAIKFADAISLRGRAHES